MADINIKLLCTRYLMSNIYRFEKIDAAAMQEAGNAYAERPWGEQDFLADFEGKYMYSQEAVDSSGGLAGFLIAGLRAPGNVHIYRLAVDRRYRQRGLDEKMLARLEQIARQNRIRVISVVASPRNTDTYQFFQDAGYTEVDKHDKTMPNWFNQQQYTVKGSRVRFNLLVKFFIGITASLFCLLVNLKRNDAEKGG